MEIITFEENIKYLPSFIQTDGFKCIVKSNKTICLKGMFSDLNEDVCKANNVQIYNTNHFGGTIVNFKEDLCFAKFTKGKNIYIREFIHKLADYLKEKGLNITIDNNDILVDGYKCASFMSVHVKEYFFAAAHISIGMDIDLIKKICNKPMKKTPIGLKEYGVTTTMVKEFIEQFVEEMGE